jgi:uncharacterized membrane protein
MISAFSLPIAPSILQAAAGSISFYGTHGATTLVEMKLNNATPDGILGVQLQALQSTEAYTLGQFQLTAMYSLS